MSNSFTFTQIHRCPKISKRREREITKIISHDRLWKLARWRRRVRSSLAGSGNDSPRWMLEIARRFPVNANGKQERGGERVEAHSASLTRMSMTWRRKTYARMFYPLPPPPFIPTEEQAPPISITRRPSICHTNPNGTLPRSFPPNPSHPLSRKTSRANEKCKYSGRRWSRCSTRRSWHFPVNFTDRGT